jgi:hypothetical protein
LLSWLFFGAKALTGVFAVIELLRVRPTIPLWINCLGVTNRDGIGSHKFSDMALAAAIAPERPRALLTTRAQIVDQRGTAGGAGTCALRTSTAIAGKNMASADELLTDPYLFVDL